MCETIKGWVVANNKTEIKHTPPNETIETKKLNKYYIHTETEFRGEN